MIVTEFKEPQEASCYLLNYPAILRVSGVLVGGEERRGASVPAPSGRVHTWPCVRKLAIRAPFTAFSILQSEKMMRGDLPPSSKVMGLTPLADISMICRTEQDIQKFSVTRSTGPEPTSHLDLMEPFVLLKYS